MLVTLLHATNYYLITSGRVYVVCAIFDEFSIPVRIVIHDIYYVHDSFIAFLYNSYQEWNILLTIMIAPSSITLI